MVLAAVDSRNPQNVTGLTERDLPFTASSVPSIKETEHGVKEKCEKNGGPEAFGKVQVAKKQVTECVQSQVNITELQKEMELAKHKADFDRVFKKYSQKSPILQECISNFTTTVEPCLEPEEKESKRVIHNITDSLLNFICFKDGDRIALFIAEGGPQCFEEKRSGIEDCLNKTTSKYIPKNMSSTLPVFVLGEKEYADMKAVQGCVVNVLEQCFEHTPANIVKILFNYIWKITSCSKMALQDSGDASGADNSVTPSGAANSITPYGAANSVTPSGTANSITPSGAANSVTPYGAANSVTPSGTANSITPSGAANSVTPSGAANSVTPSRAANSITPFRTANSVIPFGAANSVTHSGAAKSVTPFGILSTLLLYILTRFMN